MIRTTLLWMFVAFLAAYAWRDWYKSLCGLILLMGVIAHPDFPKSLMGVQGLNPWNVLFFVVFIAWLSARRREGLKWDMPKYVQRLLIIYGALVLISFLRMCFNLDPLLQLAAYYNIEPVPFPNLVSELIINCFKWVVPGLMLYDGCRSEERFRLATYCILAVYAVLAIQVIRWMPLSMLSSGSDLAERSIKILENEVGFHRVTMSMVFAGGAWAIFCVRLLPRSSLVQKLAIATSGMVIFAMALTGGRMGIVTWAVMALIFGLLRWRKVLVLAPVAVALVVMTVPAIQQRMMEGFTEGSIDRNSEIDVHFYDTSSGPDLYTVTAGRTFAWHFVIEEIAKSPLFGYGREAMKTTGTTLFLASQFGESFPHPHNAYLQWILDNGIVGFIPILLFYWFVVKMSMNLFRDRDNIYATVIGGICLSLVLALLIASMGSQTFYAREESVGMWCAIGLALRVYVQKEYFREHKIMNRGKLGFSEFWKVRGVQKRRLTHRYG